MVESLDHSELPIIDEILTTGPMAVTEAKRLALNFDRWTGTDEELRRWTLDKTSEIICQDNSRRSREKPRELMSCNGVQDVEPQDVKCINGRSSQELLSGDETPSQELVKPIVNNSLTI